MNWPVYFKERLWLVNPQEGFVGVVTLWTPKELIAPHLNRKVSVCGQLYTKRGIEYIIRNVWLNPKIRWLVLVGQERTKSGQALVNFFQKGVEKKNGLWQICGIGQAYLPSQFPKKELEFFRKKIGLIDLRGETNVEKINKQIEKLRFLGPFSSKAKKFPHPKVETEVFPSEISGFRVEGETIGLAWLEILKIILRFGWQIPRLAIYGGKERMVLNLIAVITAENIKKPRIYPFFEFRKSDLKNYFKNFFSPQRGNEGYTYGERIFNYQKSPWDETTLDQLTIMAKKLKSFAYNKGALITLWNPSIDNFPIRKPWRTPCLSLIQGVCSQNKLHLTAYFRSNDMFNAWPQNAFALRKLQAELAKKIGKKVGFLTTVSCSAFIDESDLPHVQRVVKKYDRLFCQPDPRGNLVVLVEGKDIVVRHLSPEGLVLGEFREDGSRPKAAMKLAQKLVENQVISRIDHALDIGEQLGRAEDALRLGLKFEQDKSLQRPRKRGS